MLRDALSDTALDVARQRLETIVALFHHGSGLFGITGDCFLPHCLCLLRFDVFALAAICHVSETPVFLISSRCRRAAQGSLTAAVAQSMRANTGVADS